MRKKMYLCLTLLALLIGSRAWAQENEPLSFGVISDIHFGNGVGEGPMVKVPQALKNLTSQGQLDVLAVVGDLANSGSASEYVQLVGVFQDKAVCPDITDCEREHTLSFRDEEGTPVNFHTVIGFRKTPIEILNPLFSSFH